MNSKVNTGVNTGVKLVDVVKSKTKGKKWDAHFLIDGKEHVTHFGATGYTDYTLGATDDQHARYLQRHHKDLASHDPTSAGYLSYYILWGTSRSMHANIAEFKKRFRL